MLAWLSARNHVNLQDFPFRGYAGRVSARFHVNLQDSPFRGYAGRPSAKVMYIYRIFRSKAILAGYKKSCKFTGLPVQRICWQVISKKSCKFTEFSVQRLCWQAISKKSCELTGFPLWGGC